jgi:hypothetical protein
MSRIADISAQAASSGALPEWAVLFAFAASLVLSILKIVEIARGLIKLGRLELRLTGDVRMRVVADGEVFFVDAAFLAKRGNVLVRNAHFKLLSRGEVKKELPLHVKWVGEKVYAIGKPFPDFHFISSSILEFIPENTPRRVLYVAEVSKYAPQIRAEFAAFTKQCESWAAEGADSAAGVLGLSQERQKVISVEVDRLIANTAGALAKHVQLEAGKYCLEMTVRYEPTTPWWIPRKTRESKSAIDFEIGQDISQLRARIAENLRQQSRVITYNSKELFEWPEYSPISTMERPE